MYIVQNYSIAVLFCIVTMLCWGSWGNTQKLAAKTWRYELYYWDYVIGIFLFSIIWGFSLGSIGSEGQSFVLNLSQAAWSNIGSALWGGVVFNAGNILLSAAVALAGMSVAFPLGVGIALVLGVFINYWSDPKGDPIILFAGVFCIVLAIIFNGVASARIQTDNREHRTKKKGLLIAVCAGILMAFFYRFVAASMDLENFERPALGKLTPYAAFFIFSLGILLSNFIFNTYLMKKPFVGIPVKYSQYFHGTFRTHLVGMLGGVIWGLGTALSYIAAGKAGTAISYALGQGAPMIAALWGVFIWKEFKGGDKNTYWLLFFMFILFIAGLALIILSGGN